MKKLAFLTTVALFCGMAVTSCKDDGCKALVDGYEPVSFVIKDIDGNNLLDPRFAGNILDNDIEVTSGQNRYPLIMAEYGSVDLGTGLYVGETGADNIPVIMFWGCYAVEEREGHYEEFSIDWGDGTADRVRAYYTYTIDDCEVVMRQRTYLNGNLNSGNSLTVTIVK